MNEIFNLTKKVLFIDRDGTLILEPPDKQVDSLDKFFLMPNVIPALLQLKNAGFSFVMITNQDGLGTKNYPKEKYQQIQTLLLNLLSSQGIDFEAIHVCPHTLIENCGCRKPRLGLVMDYLADKTIDRENSYVIGDRETDLELAKNMGIQGILMCSEAATAWVNIIKTILCQDRKATIWRKTRETSIELAINLDDQNNTQIQTGIGFFDHMLEQLSKHGGFSLKALVHGDLHIDDHHTVEDTALALGEAIKKALGEKRGISRYGFLLPMDEALTQVALDLSGRTYFAFEGKFHREQVGNFSTELVPHFFRSLSEALKATLHIQVKGENTHHMIESTFKAVGRTLRQAKERTTDGIPSTKGTL